MAIVKKSSMQIKRGFKSNLPLLKDGQLGYCKDSNELWIGNDGENMLINSSNSDNVTAEFIKLISPNGTAFKLSVDNDGQLLINKEGGDVTPPEEVSYKGLLINQVYGGGSNAACSHHFVELYNTTDKDINLEGLSLYGATYKAPDWQHVPLTGTIPSKCSFLIRGVESTGSIVPIDNFDLTCSLRLDKAMKVFLIKSTDPEYLKGIVNPWNVDGKFTMIDGYIDGFGCHGNSGLMGDSLTDTIDGFETEAPGGGDPGTTIVGCGGNSKQTSMRRKAFADTDINSEDFEALRYANFLTDPTLKDKQPRWVAYGPWDADDKFGGEDVVLTGSVIINYVDIELGSLDIDKHIGLELGTHTFEAREFPNFSKVGETSKTVVLDKDNLSHTITFTYSMVPGEKRKGLKINTMYGGGADFNNGSVSHSYVELYNDGTETESLEGKTLHHTSPVYPDQWIKFALNGEIPPKHSYLIRFAHTNNSTSPAPVIDLTNTAVDLDFPDQFITNKGSVFALMNSTDDMPLKTDPSTLETYIDMIGGTDDEGMKVQYFEGVAAYNQSKNRAIRRIDFSDSGNNRIDCESVDFRFPETSYDKYPRYLAYGPWDEYEQITPPITDPSLDFVPDVPSMINNTFGTDPSTTRNVTWVTGLEHKGTLMYKTGEGEYITENPTIVEFGDEAIHTVKLTGLTANTQYTYKVSALDVWSEEATFKTADESSNIEFIHITDTQSVSVDGYTKVGNDLAVALTNTQSEFIVHTGDIVEDNEPKFWRGFFDKAKASLMNNAFIQAGGNNDVTINKDMSVNLDIIKKHFAVENRCPINEASYSFEYKNTFFLSINHYDKLLEQREWIEQQLTNTSKKWKVVLIHAAPYTEYKEDTMPYATIFEKTNVDLVLCGHKHEYMRSFPMKNDQKVDMGQGPIYVMGNSMGIKQGKLTKKEYWMDVLIAPGKSTYNKINITDETITVSCMQVDTDSTITKLDECTITKGVAAAKRTTRKSSRRNK